MERAAETFQDRLVTELRLAGASSRGEANRGPEQFLPRLQPALSRVPPQYPEPAFRPLVSRVKHYCRIGADYFAGYLLSVATLLGRDGAVARDVEFKDDVGMHHPVNGRRGGHGVGCYAQRPPLVVFGDEGEEDLGLLGPLGQIAQVVQEQEVEVV